MSYGTIKVDTITFTDGGVDKSVSVSGLTQNPTFSGNLTVTGTISGVLVQGQTVSGATVTGDAGVFTTVTGGSAGFTTVTGTTVTGTTANFNAGTFTSQVSGATVTGNLAQFTTLTGGTAGFTTVTGATVTGTTANFVTVSGTTVTGNAGQFTTITGTSAGFTTITGATVTGTVGNFGSGSAAAPSVSVGTTDNGIYSPGTDQVALSTNGTGRLFVDASGRVGINTSTPERSLGLWSATNDDGIQIRNTSSAASVNKNSRLQFVGTDTVGTAKGTANIYCLAADQDLVGAHLSFWTRGSDVNAERLRITSAGLVGIGTSSPTNTLHVYNATADVIAVIESGNSISRLLLKDSGGSNYISTVGTNLDFATDGVTSKMRITGAGNVGIGVTSPSLKLSVDGDVWFGNGGGVETGRLFNDAGVLHLRASSNVTGLALGTNGSEKARIDSSGRLLVGTSSAVSTSLIGTAALQVAGTTNATAQASISRFSGDSDKARLAFLKSRSGIVGTNTIVLANDTLGEITFHGADGSGASGYPIGAWIRGEVDGTPGANDMPGRLVFSTTADGASSPTERMRIAQDGGISTAGITTAPSATVFGTFIGRVGAAGFFETSRNQGAGVNVGVIRGNAGTLNIHGDGDCENTNNSYTGISDIKLKENVVDANLQWDDIKALRVRNYNFKPETGFNTHTQIGLVAQEVELVSPGLVGESLNEETGEFTKSVNYSVLYMKAVKALQEAMERIETLEAKVAALESA